MRYDGIAIISASKRILNFGHILSKVVDKNIAACPLSGTPGRLPLFCEWLKLHVVYGFLYTGQENIDYAVPPIRDAHAVN